LCVSVCDSVYALVYPIVLGVLPVVLCCVVVVMTALDQLCGTKCPRYNNM
jgi:hypothetical protein